MRNVLKLSAKVFDPLGFMAPVTVRARILLQVFHERRHTWNESLNHEEIEAWREIYFELQQLSTITIPRYIGSHDIDTSGIQYHCFSDASKDVYAAAIYLRLEHKGQVKSNLMIAKSRVAPIKKEQKLTIPRLELMGAMLATRLLCTVRKSLKLRESNNAISWMDSKCMLSWLHTNRELPTFVKNRVHEICNTPNISFRYVPSAENIADLPSRTCSAAELKENTAWWYGLDWLKKPESAWPEKWKASEKYPLPENETQKQDNTALAIASTIKYSPFDINLEKFNTYTKLIRVTAYSIRFIRRIARAHNPFHDPNITSYDYAKTI